MKKYLISFLGCLLFTFSLSAQESVADMPFMNPDLPIEKRVEDVLSRLTPEEKVGLMMNSAIGVERLGIPSYNWWNEALHGVARAGLATVFPQAIGMAAAFDEAEHLKTYTVISNEGRAKYHHQLEEGEMRQYYGLTYWTPNINIFRDPRWGRGQETYGEDPYLTGRLGVAAVKGLQGDDSEYLKAHACAKHYAVHSGPEWNRHSYDAYATSRDLWETYLPAFEELVKEGNVQEVMCAYNRFEGDPCCTSDKLLIQILREKWGYQGLVVTDCGAIDDFFRKGAHETHPDAAAASVAAVLSGADVECGSSYKSLKQALADGMISEEQLDVSLARLFKAQFELGMFDPQDRVKWSKIPYSVLDSPENSAQSLLMARKSMTLLKNQNNVLPLSKDIKTIAVIGANADDGSMLLGNYNGTPSDTTTILEGIRAKLPNAKIIFDKGCDLTDPYVRDPLMSHFTSNGKSGMTAQFYNTADFTGNAVAKSQLQKVELTTLGGNSFGEGVATSNFSGTIEGTFKAPKTQKVYFTFTALGAVEVLVDGKVVLKQEARTMGQRRGNGGGAPAGGPSGSAPAGQGGQRQNPQQQERSASEMMSMMRRFAQAKIFEMDVEKGKEYDVVVKYSQGEGGFGAFLNFNCYEQNVMQFDALAAKVKEADAIIYVGGLSPKLEGEEMPVNAEGFKGGDRETIVLPQVQRSVLKALRGTGKPVVFVLCTGSALALTDDEANYDALLNAWYAGQEGGTAVADVLFGDYNPAGRLPVTFYKSLDQLPDFLDYTMNGRTYRYMTQEPLYPFGYGLSYTTYAYSGGKLSAKKIKAGDDVQITFEVANTGKKDGEEVAQVYVKRLNDANAPVKSLKGFSRVPIKAGKTTTLTFNLDPKAFTFYDENKGDLVVKPGKYQIMYGGSSADSALKTLELEVIE